MFEMSESVIAKGTGQKSGVLTGSAEDLVFIGCARLAAGGCSGYQVSRSGVPEQDLPPDGRGFHTQS